MTEADNNGLVPQSQDPASDGPMIPKHRLDEVLARVRALDEEVRIKNDLINQIRPQHQPQAEAPINFEEMNVDPALGKVIMRIADQIASKKVQEASGAIVNQMANLAQTTEETRFLQSYGHDKSKYLDKIKSLRVQHWNNTRTPLPMDSAYKMVMFDELIARTAPKAPAAQPDPTQAQAAAPQAPQGYPDAAQTRAPQGGALPTTKAKTTSEMSETELEAFLNAQMNSQGVQI